MNGKEPGMRTAAQIALNGGIEYDREIMRQGGMMYEFRKALSDRGFQFRLLDESRRYMPEHKETMVPIVLEYYAKMTDERDRQTLLRWLYYKGLYEAVPTLLGEFNKSGAEAAGDCLLWAVGDTLYQIRCPAYAEEYLEIVRDKSFGVSRQMLVLLLGSIRYAKAVPVLLPLLSDSDISLHVLTALGMLGGEECVPPLEGLLEDLKSVPKGPQKTARKRAAEKALDRIRRRLQKAAADTSAPAGQGT